MPEHDSTKADAVELARLEERFLSFQNARALRDRQVDRRFEGIEREVKHLDDGQVSINQKLGAVVDAMMIFQNPLRWLKQNWLAVLVIAGGFTILGGGSVGAALKVLAKIVE